MPANKEFNSDRDISALFIFQSLQDYASSTITMLFVKSSLLSFINNSW